MRERSTEKTAKAGILVFTSVFPNNKQPGLGMFVRERLFRLGTIRPIVVVAPTPWSPFDGLVRLSRPHFRPTPAFKEIQQGVEVFHPRFISLPGLFKGLDALSMALCSWNTIRRLRNSFDFRVIDSHFAFPDGLAAVKLGQLWKIPVTITLRGTEVSLSRFPARRRRIVEAVNRASRVFSVADSLKAHVGKLGARTEHIVRIGNGVDGERFHPEDRAEARRRLGIPKQAKVLISVGALCERKGFHRVIEQIPGLLKCYPELLLLIVGGASPEGDWSQRLQEQVERLGLKQHVRFLGQVAPDELRWPLSAADLFVLATGNEGWANVFLEAMACGLPVVTTDVGGNREVVCRPELGMIVPFSSAPELGKALLDALGKSWDHEAILQYARDNDWSTRVTLLDREFARLAGEHRDDR